MKWTSERLDLFKTVLSGAAHDESGWLTLGAIAWDTSTPPWKKYIGRRLHKWLEKHGWMLVRPLAYDAERRKQGEDWPLVGYTMIGQRRLDQLQDCVETILREDVPGDLLETGVWRGGACLLMKAVLESGSDRQRTVWLADSFNGLPPPENAADGWDLSSNPYLAVSAAQVRRNFERFGLLDDKIRLIEGWFDQTLATAPVGPLALLRLDGDLYSSTRTALDALYEKVSPGGFVVVDDYHAWPSCRRAVNDFLNARGEQVALTDIDRTAVFWRKAGLAA